jgi:uncharacterized protein YccT (UPF0319 family)
LHSEDADNLYCSPNIVRVYNSRKMKLARHIARMEEMRDAYKILVVNLKRLQWRLLCRWQNNVKIDLRRMKRECVDCGSG